MQIHVMSRVKAQRFFRSLTTEEKSAYACVAITGFEDDPVTRWLYPKNTLFLTFDDVDKADFGNIPMDEMQARQIALFVKALPDTIDNMIVHCEAGMSRSAGVAAAIMKWMDNDDSPIFDVPRYRPNMRCYRMTLEALMKEAEEA